MDFLGTLRAAWNDKRIAILRGAVILLGAYAALKLGDEFRRLLFETSGSGAVDLGIVRDQTRAWFEGNLVYVGNTLTPHPPATFVILYPFVGWLDFPSTRWLWAITTVPILGYLIAIALRASQAPTRLERALVALMLLAMNATGVAIGNGQLILHVLAALLTGLLWLRDSNDWRRDVGAGILLALALVKLNIAAPFLWLALLTPRRPRPLALVTLAVCYLALTAFALAFQPSGALAVLSMLLSRGSTFAYAAGYANVTNLLSDLGLISWSLPGSALVFAALGVWIYFHRQTDWWTLVGVSALVARLWIFHMLYDDVLIFLASLALFRIARRESDATWRALAGTLVAITIAAMLFLAQWQFAAPPLNWIFIWGHAAVWIADLFFLLASASRAPTENFSATQ